MKSTVMIAFRRVALTVFYFISFTAISAALLPSPSEQPAQVQAGAALAALLAVSLLNTLVLGYVVLRSRWTGWKLVLTIFFVFYGVMTVMSQVDTAFFVTRLPPGRLTRLFLSRASSAPPFSAPAV